MHIAPSNTVAPAQLLHLLRRHVLLWLLPTVAIAAAVGVYAAVHQAAWEASQALIVRNEAAGAEKGPGKFSQPEEMKTVQETILEVVRSRGVLEAALKEVGPPANYEATSRRTGFLARLEDADGLGNPSYGATSAAWPTDRDIDEARKNVKLAPPKGAEFGKTEVFYLDVRAEDRARSIALNEAIFKQLRVQFQKLRDAKAQSMVDELTKTVHLAKADLDGATAALAATEHRLGSDLAELRSMQDMASSDSALRRSGEDIRAQLRENAAAEKVSQELLAVVTQAQNDPGRLAATPNRLLESHPSLRRLKDGLIDAQLRTAAMLGMMSANHPKVLAAREAEAEIGRNLHDELASARRGIEIELRLVAQRHALLEDQLAKTNGRLGGLAEVRAEYANQVTEARNRGVLLERAEQNLAEARAARASATAASLLSRIDAPDAGIRPVGPGRITIALGGILGGLLTGFGLVFLAVPVGATVAASPAPALADGTRRVPATSTNGHARQLTGRNGSSLLPANSNGHLSVKGALQRLANGRG